MKKQFRMMLVIALFGLLIQGCTDQQTTTPSSNTPTDEVKAEGEIRNTWISENADLPSPYKDTYERMEFTVDADDNYSWKWVAKTGEITDFTGNVFYQKSEYKHGESSIWGIVVNVTHINGESLPGGWYGVCAFETENVFLLNVEPNIASWGEHPTEKNGIGSGSSGDDSVFKFNLSR